MTVIDPSVTQLSPAARDRLAAEEQELDARRAELVVQQQSSESGGDLVDQASVAAQHLEIESLDRRLSHIRELLASAIVVEGAGGDTVSIGSVVTLRFDDGSTETYHVGLIEEQDDNVVALTPTSPLGQALLGHSKGDSVTYDAPAGQLTVQLVGVAAA